MLKKGNWQERGPVTDQCHDRSGKLDKRSDKKLERISSQRRSSDARQLGCIFQDMTPPKSILRMSANMRRPIQRVKFTKAIGQSRGNESSKRGGRQIAYLIYEYFRVTGTHDSVENYTDLFHYCSSK